MAEAERSLDFGGRMRRLREARGVTLRDISSATNISVAQLEALERNDMKRLPGGIFRRGIVRAYAQQVGEDPDATVRDFVSNVAGETFGSPHVYQTDYEKATTPRRGRTAILVLAVLIVVCLLAWLLLSLT
jgi:cytoskeletal protein RodZ